MSSRPLKLAAISLTTTADKAASVAQAVAAVREAAAKGADWIQLPEMFAFMGPYDQLAEMAEPLGGPLCRTLAALARELQIVLIAGTVGELPAADEPVAPGPGGQRRVFNTCRIYGRQGQLLASYRKTHLFNLRADGDRPAYRESDGYAAGDRLVTVDIEGWRVGLSICYDLRFPELYRRLATTSPLDIIVAPSAFTHHTGEHHWTLLLRARAIEQQAYVFAANQVGIHNPGSHPVKASWGHSQIVSPWGEVLADSQNEPAIALATVEKSVIDQVRAKLPVLSNRRPELYQAEVAHFAL